MGLGDVALSHLLPSYRSEYELSINERFLRAQKKNLILKNLQVGFRADWAPIMPKVLSTPINFLSGAEAIKKARARFKSEVEKGRMLGGIGWTREKVEDFLQKKVYVIPCGAVPKNGDKNGRIIIIVIHTKRYFP